MMSRTNRIVLHCDRNTYYTSAKELLRSELKDVTIVVAGNPENRHGIILAKDEHAKCFGVQTAATIWQAKRKCSELVCVPPHHDRCQEISHDVNQSYLQCTGLADRFNIDESFLDVTGILHQFKQTS